MAPLSALATAVLAVAFAAPLSGGVPERPPIEAPRAAEEPSGTAERSLALLAGWGHSWRHGLPGYGETRTDVWFAAFHPQMGWFLADRLEMYGEATLLVYGAPGPAVSVGVAPLAARYHLRDQGRWRPYLTLGAGVLWTSLDVVEIDRSFNFQVLYGVGIREFDDGGPGWMLEFRNHHISNAGTAPPNIGINAATLIGGLTWILP